MGNKGTLAAAIAVAAAGAGIGYLFLTRQQGGFKVTVTASPLSTSIGRLISFSAAPSGGVAPYSYEWQFGDGALSTDQFPSHSYTAAGTYAVLVTVTDSTGATATGTVSVMVTGAGGGLLVSASASPIPAAAGQQVTFAASISGGAPPYGVTWQFGDGTSGAGATTTHAYSAPGSYLATVSVVDTLGGSATASVNITIVAGTFAIKVVDSATSQPIPGATVLYGTISEATGTNGTATFSVQQGQKLLEVSAAGYQTIDEPNFVAQPGQSYTIPLNSLSVAALTVEVENPGLSPIPGATVSVDGMSGTTNSLGMVSFQGLVPGTTYTLTASAPGFEPASEQFIMPAGGQTLSIILTTAGGTLIATVVSPPNGAMLSAGSPMTFSGSAGGGTGPYTYRWFIGGIEAVPDGQTITVTPSSQPWYFGPGLYDAELTVRDSVGNIANALVSFYLS